VRGCASGNKETENDRVSSVFPQETKKSREEKRGSGENLRSKLQVGYERMLLKIATKNKIRWKLDSFWAPVTTWELLPLPFYASFSVQ
jgi:hypothetical protein